MSFIQTISVRVEDPDALARHLEGWHQAQAGVAPGYRGARILADRDHPGRHVVEVEFSSAQEAERNNDRDETRAWAERLRELVEGEPEYGNYRAIFSTDGA